MKGGEVVVKKNDNKNDNKNHTVHLWYITKVALSPANNVKRTGSI